MQKRRYEILLPLKHNDGTPVSHDLIEQSREELCLRFEGVSIQPPAIQGLWRSNGEFFDEELLRVVVDVNDTEENRQFFTDYKAMLRERFQQIEIYIVSYPIDLI